MEHMEDTTYIMVVISIFNTSNYIYPQHCDLLHLFAAELQNQPARNMINVYVCNCSAQ